MKNVELFARNFKDYDECSDNISIDTSERPFIICENDERNVVECDKLIKKIREYKIKNTEEIYIGTKKCLLDAFKDDENIQARLDDEDCLGVNRNELGHRMNKNIPRQIIAVTDHPDYKDMYGWDVEDELITTILHEEGHLCGSKREYDAEVYAQLRKMGDIK